MVNPKLLKIKHHIAKNYVMGYGHGFMYN